MQTGGILMHFLFYRPLIMAYYVCTLLFLIVSALYIRAHHTILHIYFNATGEGFGLGTNSRADLRTLTVCDQGAGYLAGLRVSKFGFRGYQLHSIMAVAWWYSRLAQGGLE